ncbi:limonene-1,2-epoxide hydrolase family protein [Lolliginicoccus levis]|uniref:limonene-1,2-epoxide hydrolase family protein n=1 Tax=Lolliginicoccus levis TaxID=2919542 RepID=UPI00241CD494|nr:limonene-1,2-epoxide hydrolase family protein [Lolliginicoccus levis]
MDTSRRASRLPQLRGTGVPAVAGDDAIAVVRAFLAALERGDVEAAAQGLHPQVELRIVPFRPVEGIAPVLRQLRKAASLISSMDITIHSIAANGETVLTERTHRIALLGSIELEFWMCGTFELADGSIAVWRDRFDLAEMTASMIRGVGTALSRLQIEQSPRR